MSNAATGSTPHILLINHEFPPVGGGAATATANIAGELALLGVQVTVLTGIHGAKTVRECKGGYTLIRIPMYRPRKDMSNPWEMLTFMFSALWWMLRHGRKMNASACIAFFGLPAGPSAWLLHFLTGTPYIVSLRGGDVPGMQPEQLKYWHWVTKGVLRFLWSRAAHVVANSSGLAELARKTAGNIPVQVIPNGVDTEVFHPGKPSRSGTLTLLHVGRLNPRKSIETLLDALPEVPGDWHLVLIGDGPDRDKLTVQASTLGISEKIDFAGWKERGLLPDIYRNADIFVFPSKFEGLPNVVLEAMSSGLPVIACPVAGCEDLVINEETGLLFPVQNSSALAGTLRKLCADKSLRKKLGRNGRDRVEKEFSWKSTAQKYYALCAAGAMP